MSAIRVLHCPRAVGGNPAMLARAERAIGLDSWAVSLGQPQFGYEIDEVLWRPRVLQQRLQRLRLLLRALRSFDVVHFNFGSSIFPQYDPPFESTSPAGPSLRRLARSAYARMLELRDLPLLKQAGKAIVVTYQGDDARQGEVLLGKRGPTIASEVDERYYHPSSDEAKRRRIQIFDRYADRIHALNPDLLRVLPPRATFMPYASVDLRVVRPEPPPSTRTPVVLHAPSHRGTKGTRHVISAVERLRSGGIDFEFRLVEGLSHDLALEEYRRADVVIDQVVSGWYGALAVEAMALGRPVVAYIDDEDLVFIPPQMRRELPLIRATPGDLSDVLRELLTAGRTELPRIGEESRRYVERWHDPLEIASALRDEYEEILR